jgi:hypothetical protein
MEDFTEDLINREEAKTYYEDPSQANFVETLLKEDIPASKKENNRDLLEDFFAIINRNLKLSFFDDVDLFTLESLFEDAIITLKMSKPNYAFTFEQLQVINQLKMTLRSSLKRSVGMKNDKMNERSLQSSQIHEIRRSNTESINAGRNNGFGSKISNYFNG